MKKLSVNAKAKSLLFTGFSAAVLAFGGVSASSVVQAADVPGEGTTDGRVSSIIVHYQDEAGNKIAEDQVFEGHVNIGYGSIRKAIKGYTLKDWQGPTEGFFSDQPQTVTYIYSKGNEPAANEAPTNSSQTERPNNQGSKENSTNKKKPVASVSTTDKKDPVVDPSNTAATLPQTGTNEYASLNMMFAGIAALVVSFLGMVGLRRKQS